MTRWRAIVDGIETEIVPEAETAARVPEGCTWQVRCHHRHDYLGAEAGVIYVDCVRGDAAVCLVLVCSAGFSLLEAGQELRSVQIVLDDPAWAS